MITWSLHIAMVVILAWSTWCVLSPNINDGIVGKILFSTVAMAALAELQGGENDNSIYILLMAIVFLIIRQYAVVNFWPSIRDRLIHRK